jgi:hypothetical protein
VQRAQQDVVIATRALRTAEEAEATEREAAQKHDAEKQNA